MSIFSFLQTWFVFLFWGLCFYIFAHFHTMLLVFWWWFCESFYILEKWAFMPCIAHLLFFLVGHWLYSWFFHASYFYFHIIKSIKFFRDSGFYAFIRKAFSPGAYNRISHMLSSGTFMVLLFLFKFLIQLELILL